MFLEFLALNTTCVFLCRMVCLFVCLFVCLWVALFVTCNVLNCFVAAVLPS